MESFTIRSFVTRAVSNALQIESSAAKPFINSRNKFMITPQLDVVSWKSNAAESLTETKSVHNNIIAICLLEWTPNSIIFPWNRGNRPLKQAKLY